MGLAITTEAGYGNPVPRDPLMSKQRLFSANTGRI